MFLCYIAKVYWSVFPSVCLYNSSYCQIEIFPFPYFSIASLVWTFCYCWIECGYTRKYSGKLFSGRNLNEAQDSCVSKPIDNSVQVHVSSTGRIPLGPENWASLDLMQNGFWDPSFPLSSKGPTDNSSIGG